MEKEVNFMELRDIINDVSEFYRNENGKIGELMYRMKSDEIFAEAMRKEKKNNVV